ncbi:MAG: YceH family protein [Synoicihabitans sp.]
MENESDVSSESESQLVLSALEARVLGSLMEKEATTPDVYPLSLNSLVNACNQKNNRNPVMAVDDEQALAAIELLRDKHLLTLFSGANSRAIKYRHKFAEVWPVEPAAQAFLCDLMLRGPQTAAGLRGNCERLAAVPDLAGAEELLADLAARPGGALVQKLPRQPGQKEARWTALIVEGATELANSTAEGGTDSGASRAPVTVAMKLPEEAEARIAALEAEVKALREELSELRESLGG